MRSLTLWWIQEVMEEFDAEEESLKPLYAAVSAALVLMAGLMSGLTLALMSLDNVDLEVLMRGGTDKEKRYAQRILPVIRKPHWTLTTLLLGNAVCAEALPIFLDRLVDPTSAILLSVTVVLVFGEIIPQALCTHYGLAIGAYSAWFVQLLMWLTAPVSWPISKILDYLLGAEHSALFRRAHLKAFVDIHSQSEGLGGYLAPEEIAVIRGALDLTHKVALAGMTPLDKVFMVPSDFILNRENMKTMLAAGHSRIPVHKPGNRKEILGLILAKELMLIDPDDALPVSALRLRGLPHVRADTPMYDLLKLFRTGRSHMVVLTRPQRASVESGTPHRQPGSAHTRTAAVDLIRVSTAGNVRQIDRENTAGEHPEEDLTAEEQGDLAEPLGIITIEDVLEELIQQEIVDETDQFVDNARSQRVNMALLLKDLPASLRSVLVTRRVPLPAGGGAPGEAPSGGQSRSLPNKAASLATPADLQRVSSPMPAAASAGRVRTLQRSLTDTTLAAQEDLSRPLLHSDSQNGNNSDLPDGHV